MHLAQGETLLYFNTRIVNLLHASCSVWIITSFGYKATRTITCILLSVDHYFLWKKSRRAITCISLNVDRHFI